MNKKHPFYNHEKNPQEEEEPEPNLTGGKKEDTSEEPEETKEKTAEDKEKEVKDCDTSPLLSPLFDLDEADEELDVIDMMIQSHHHKNNPQSYGAANSAFRQSGFHQVRKFFLLSYFF